jgi:hypothetical protein
MLCILGAACSDREKPETNTFLLRREQVDVAQEAGAFLQRLTSSLQAQGVLEGSYPKTGVVTLTPDLLDPNANVMRCTPGQPVDPQVASCLLLNPAGDFARVQPVTWQSAAFYMYRIYVIPRTLFARVDLSKDFVAVDLFLMQETGRWDEIVQAVQEAAQELGARPYEP